MKSNTDSREIRKFLFEKCDMDLVGFCPASAMMDEPEGRRPTDILPCAKSIIVYGKRLLNGAVQAQFRRLEDKNASCESVYETFGFELAPGFTMMFDTFNLTNFLERFLGASTQPLACAPNQNGVSFNMPMPLFAGPYREGIPFNINKAAVACGLAQMSWSNWPVTKEFGPRVQFGAIITDLELDYDEPDKGPRLCDPEKCNICSKMCPVDALPAKGEGEAKKVVVNGQEYEISAHNRNACMVAALGLREEFQGVRKYGDLVSSNNPTDEEIMAAYKAKPISHTNLDHYPKSFCNKCQVYCPIGSWDETFGQTGLAKAQKE